MGFFIKELTYLYKINYLSPNKVFLDLVEPLVLKPAFLFLPEVAFLRSRMYSVFLVLDAIFIPRYLNFKQKV